MGLDPNTVYYFAVRAYNTQGASPMSPEVSGTSPAAVTLTGRTDFNEDGSTDLLWQHSNGSLAAWFMNDATMIRSAYLMPRSVGDANWRVVAMADFNDDLTADILWQHQVTGGLAVWFMRGGMMTRSVWLTPSALPERAWRIVAAEDFDGDGDPDILWKQADTGGMVLWTMNGTVRTSSTWLNPASVSDLGWQVVSASDWNNDGRADLLWHHRVSGGLAVWYMNGPNRTGTGWLAPTAVDPAWRVVGTGLVNGDTSRDLIWENRQTGDLVVWFMNGTRMSTLSYLTPSRIPDRDWRVVAIR